MLDQTNTEDLRRRRLDEVIGAFLVALDAGQNPSPQEWLARYPELHTELAQFFADRARMDELVEPLRVSPNTTTDGAFGDPKATHENGATIPLPRGTQVRYFGDYELQKVLGEGGMGIVYKARQISLNRAVALKMIRAARFPYADEVHRFQNEAEAVARLDHPHIVPIFEVGRFEDQHYFSMKLIGGESLDKRLEDYAADPRRAARLVAVVAEAIHHAHQRGILHRDLKPANILVDADGHPHVTDFGLAKRVEGDSELTRSGAIVGTPAYMAPEQASAKKGTVTTATDVHGLGAILYALLTGRAPFGGTTVLDTLEQVRERPPDAPRKLNPRVPRDLEVICLKCLEKDPRRRYASADALAEDLNRWLASEPIAARPVGNAARFWMWCRRNPVVAGAAGSVAAALVVVAVLSLLYADEQNRRASEQTEATIKISGLAKNLEKESDDLKATLSDSNRRLAMLFFERAQRAFDRGQVNHGLLWLVECWRYAANADDRAWQHLAQANLAFWRYNCPDLKGVFPDQRGDPRAVFSPDGKIIVTQSNDGTGLQMWDAATNRPIGQPMLDHQAAVMPVAFSPDGTAIVTAGPDNTARLWDAASGKPIGQAMKHRGPVRTLAYSPNGKTVLTTCWGEPVIPGGDSTNRVRLWDGATGQPIGQPLQNQDSIESFAFSPDSKTVLTGHNDGTARLWHCVTAKLIGQPMVHDRGVRAVAFSPDGKIALTGGDLTVRMWDAATGMPIHRPLVHEAAVKFVAVSPDGETILTGSSDKRARLWDAATGQPIGRPLTHQGEVSSVAYSPDGKTILTGSSDKTARLWDAVTGHPVGHPFRHEDAVVSAVFSPDGRSVLTESAEGVARLWDATTTQSIGKPLEHPADVFAVAFSPDARTILTGGWDNTARSWNAATGEALGRPMVHRSAVGLVAFSPDGKTILTGKPEFRGFARLWDAASSQPIGQPMVHPERGWADVFKFSPDGRSVLTVREGASAQLWDATTSQPIGKLLKPVLAVTFSLDGRTILTASEDGTVDRLDATTGQPIGRQRVDLHGDSPVVFSPDGKIILALSGDHTVRQWVIATGQPAGEPMVHQGRVESITFSPDGNSILSESNVTNVSGEGSHDVKLRLWGAATGRPIGQSLAHQHYARSVAFSPDGKTFLAGSVDNPAQLWDAATGQPIGAPLERESVVHSMAFSPDGKTIAIASSHDTYTRNDWSSQRTVRLRHLPAPLDDDFPRIKVWVETMTGLLVNDEGNINALDPAAWQDRRQSLRQSGGPPKADHRWLLDPILYGPEPIARARAWMERGRWHEAESALTEAVGERPQNTSILLERGRFYASRGRTHEAEADFARAYTLGSRDPQLLDTILGSRALFQRLVEAIPGTTAMLWHRRGLDRVTQQHWADAAADFSKAVLLEPDHLLTRRYQIWTLTAAGDFEGLRRACSDLLDQFGSTARPATANNVAWDCVLAPGALADYKVPVRLAEIAVKGFPAPQKPAARNTLGASLYRAGRFEDAIERLKEAIHIRDGTSTPQDWVFLAMAHQRLGHHEEARRWLDRFRDRQPNPEAFWAELGIRLLRSEAEALVLYDPIFPADPFAR
jgi:eukaryotic-like serine/threonine-protein kinase